MQSIRRLSARSRVCSSNVSTGALYRLDCGYLLLGNSSGASCKQTTFTFVMLFSDARSRCAPWSTEVRCLFISWRCLEVITWRCLVISWRCLEIAWRFLVVPWRWLCFPWHLHRVSTHDICIVRKTVPAMSTGVVVLYLVHLGYSSSNSPNKMPAAHMAMPGDPDQSHGDA